MKAIDYSLKRWRELTRFVDDADVPISNNWVENQIRPIAIGRSNWLFAGSLRAGKRAAAVMSLLHSAKLNGHDPYAYLRNVLDRLPTQPASRIADACPGAAMRIETSDIEALHMELAGRRYGNARPELEETPWGSKDVTVKDPFGNRLTFTDAVST